MPKEAGNPTERVCPPLASDLQRRNCHYNKVALPASQGLEIRKSEFNSNKLVFFLPEPVIATRQPGVFHFDHPFASEFECRSGAHR